MTDNLDVWSPEKAEMFKAEFMEFLNHCVINSKETGPTCLGDNIFGSQELMLGSIFDGLTTGIHDFKFLKSRQLGCSTFARAFALFWLGVHDGLQGALILDSDANKEAARAEIMSMINNLPPDVKFPRINSQNRYGITLENGSRMNFLAAGNKRGQTNNSLGASLGLNFIIASEMCKWGNQAGVESLKPSLSKTFPNRLYIWESPLALDTPLLTPHGWTTIGVVKIGEQVFDENGQATEVVGLSPVFEGRRCFEIEFDTGEKIVSDASHKWQVERRKPKSAYKPWVTQVVTTEQLDVARDRIWLGEPIEGTDGDLPISPYFLGAWLGDGHTEAIRITCGDQDMAEMRANLKRRGIDCGPITKFKGRAGGVFGIHGLMPTFRELNLIGNKHVPEIFLRASVGQRLELLRGLMDTDGSIVTQGHCQFTNSNRALVDNVCEVLSSLGIRYHVTWVEAGPKRFANGRFYDCKSYAMIGFMPPEGMEVFSLSRKLSRQAIGNRRPRRNRVARILSIREVPSVPVKCLSVDTPTHLFKVGRTMIPTHNTARGHNLWADMWEEAQNDDLTQKATFLGWWARDDQRLKSGSALYKKYAEADLTDKEIERIRLVKEKYDVDIDMEQVAWFRQQTDPNQSLEEDEAEDPLKTQEQPWTEEEAFQITGSAFFSPTKLSECMQTTASATFQSYKFYHGTDFFHTRVEKARSLREVQLKIWEEPVPNATYVISADPAFGHSVENNHSAVQVLRCYSDRVEQVAEFADSETPTSQFAWVIAALCGWYGVGPNGTFNNTIEVIIEINGPGEAVLNAFKDLKNLVQSPQMRREATERGLKNIFQNVRNYMYARSDSYSAGNSLHWKTTSQLKEAIFYRLRDFLSSNTLAIRSQALLQEMGRVVRDGETIGAPGMQRDDRTFSMAMGIRCWEDKLRRRMLAEGKSKQHDEEQRKITPMDKFLIFNRSIITDMGKRSRMGRINASREARYKSWH